MDSRIVSGTTVCVDETTLGEPRDVVRGLVLWTRDSFDGIREALVRWVEPSTIAGVFRLYNVEELKFMSPPIGDDLNLLSEEQLRAEIDRVQTLRRQLHVETATATRAKLSSKSPAEQLKTLFEGLSEEEKATLKASLTK